MLLKSLPRQSLLSFKFSPVQFRRAQSTTIKVTPPQIPTPSITAQPIIVQPTPVILETTKENNKKPNSNSNKEKKKDQYPNLPLYLASFILGAGLAQLFPLSELAKFWISEHLPPKDSPYAENFRNSIETKLQKLPLYQQLYNDPNYEFVRAWNYVDSNTIDEVLTTGVLAVPGGIAIKPVLFYNCEAKESICIVHVGQKLCGYPFLIHGGILATLLDEIMKRSSSLKFGIDPVKEYKWDQIKTESIELQYRFPTFANQFLIIKTKLNENGDIEGQVQTIHGRLLVNGLGKYSEVKASILPVITSSVSSTKEKTGLSRFWPF